MGPVSGVSQRSESVERVSGARSLKDTQTNHHALVAKVPGSVSEKSNHVFQHRGGGDGTEHLKGGREKQTIDVETVRAVERPSADSERCVRDRGRRKRRFIGGGYRVFGSGARVRAAEQEAGGLRAEPAPLRGDERAAKDAAGLA